MGRTDIVALMVVVGMFFAYGCAQQGKAPPSEREQKEQMPSTARIVCLRADHGASPLPKSTEALNGNALTRVLTPKVAARPDGVHIQIDNRLGKAASLHKAIYHGPNVTPEQPSVTGDNIPKGKSNHVVELLPGIEDIACAAPDWYYALTFASMEIVVGESGYKSPELECNKGAKPTGRGYPADAVVPREVPKGKKFHPIEHVREEYSGKLKEGDVVETAGYPDPEEPYPRVVRVVRKGKVVATYGYYEGGREAWRTYCKGQF
jgi:hypothetical protein